MRDCVTCGLPTNKKATQSRFCAACYQTRANARKAKKPHLPCYVCGGATSKIGARARICEACARLKTTANAGKRYHADSACHLANAKRYREKHRQAVLDRQRGQRNRNRDEYLASRRSGYAANPAPHRLRSVLAGSKRRAIMRGNQSPGVTQKEWDFCLEMFGHRCAYCLKAEALTVDHVTPISRGGIDSTDNVVPACKRCNFSKNASSLLQWSLRGGGVNV